MGETEIPRCKYCLSDTHSSPECPHVPVGTERSMGIGLEQPPGVDRDMPTLQFFPGARDVSTGGADTHTCALNSRTQECSDGRR